VVEPELLDFCRVWAQSRLASHFYLGGGTALALQIHHRRSVDLDWFRRSAEERIPTGGIARELGRLFGQVHVQPVRRQSDQATWSVKGIRVTFLAYPFPLVYELVPGGRLHETLGGLWLASPREIALMKAYALGRRATFRDYIDLYFLLRGEMTSLDEILDGASRKFVLQGRQLFNARLFLEQLVYFSDLEDIDVALRLVREPVSAGEIETFFRRAVAAFVRRQTGGGAG